MDLSERQRICTRQIEPGQGIKEKPHKHIHKVMLGMEYKLYRICNVETALLARMGNSLELTGRVLKLTMNTTSITGTSSLAPGVVYLNSPGLQT